MVIPRAFLVLPRLRHEAPGRQADTAGGGGMSTGKLAEEIEWPWF